MLSEKFTMTDVLPQRELVERLPDRFRRAEILRSFRIDRG